MMEVVVTTRAKMYKAPFNIRHHQQTNMQLFLQAGCPSCRPTSSVKALKGKISHYMDCSPQAHPTLSLTIKGS